MVPRDNVANTYDTTLAVGRVYLFLIQCGEDAVNRMGVSVTDSKISAEQSL